MFETNYKIERDLNDAHAMADALLPYIYEDTLYGRAGGGLFGNKDTPVLTVGALLMQLRRLRVLADQLTDRQRIKLEQVEQQHNEIVREWPTHYESKLSAEIRSRLKAMKPYFEECKENPSLCANAYIPEAHRRTIVQEAMMKLAELHVELDDETKNLWHMVDTTLRRFIRPSDFIWDAILQPVYDPKVFFWLYNRPPVE